ncbi:DUF4242 domain-containing protein [Merismopedia glauca]|uniref:DUF4242 domain-containing protein n=1 Tax=Merismopedia glauca CCAP 1448/3 TaxID=1296344 RepID=A0A2T1C4I5_9CYAN|nr:DUF4242 domain-containing protein [Merismopedia glauca]PSB03161.1 hypothetical protein C7B64_09780 [Merismopedia glauca CCAP 1448/3]
MTRVLVEKIFDPPISEEKWNQDIEQAIPCHNAHDVRWIRSMMSRDRSRVICEFEASDAETVRRSFRKVGLPFARVWVVDVLEPVVVDDQGTIGTQGWRAGDCIELNEKSRI